MMVEGVEDEESYFKIFLYWGKPFINKEKNGFLPSSPLHHLPQDKYFINNLYY